MARDTQYPTIRSAALKKPRLAVAPQKSRRALPTLENAADESFDEERDEDDVEEDTSGNDVLYQHSIRSGSAPTSA